MNLPTSLNYPIIAIADRHGQLDQLKRLVTRLEMISEWDDCALIFLGDYNQVCKLLNVRQETLLLGSFASPHQCLLVTLRA